MMKTVNVKFFFLLSIAASFSCLAIFAGELAYPFETDLMQEQQDLFDVRKNDEPKNRLSKFVSSAKQKIKQTFTKKKKTPDGPPSSFSFEWEQDLNGTSNKKASKSVSHRPTFGNMIKGDSLKRLGNGTPVYCVLAGVVSHSGIAVGNKIVHLDGDGTIIFTSPQEFIDRLNGKNPAINIYYAAYAPNRPVECNFAASRALSQVGRKVNYNVIKKNCHAFTIWCCTGQKQTQILSIRKIDEVIEKQCGQQWSWRCWDGWR